MRVRVDPSGKQRLCFPDGTVVPYEIDSVCKQTIDQAMSGQCTYIAKYLIKTAQMPDGIEISYEINHDKSWPSIHFAGKNYAVYSAQLSPEHLGDHQTAIIEVTAYLDRSA